MVEVFDGRLGVGGGLEDGAAVLLQHAEPVAEIGSVVVARLRRDTEVTAQERGPDLGDQFFTGITCVAELPMPEVPVEAGRVFRPVRQLVCQRRVIALGIRKGREGRHLYVIGIGGVVRPIPAVANVGTGVGEEPVGRRDPLNRVERRGSRGVEAAAGVLRSARHRRRCSPS